MRAAEEDASALESALRSGRAARADELMGRIAAGCGFCHARYRNVPQSGAGSRP
jgi:hypothetical protein